MKKLLKSILIATASVGAVAGSTAAVISCGSNGGDEDNTADQAKYDAQVKAIVDSIKTQTEKKGSGFPFTNYQTDASIKQMIGTFINASIKANKSDMLSNITDPSASIQFLPITAPAKFSASFPGRGEVPQAGTHDSKSVGIKVTIPKSSTAKAKETSVDLEMGYDVRFTPSDQVPNQTDYNNAKAAIIAAFATAPIFTAYPGITVDQVKQNIQANVFAAVNGITDTKARLSLEVLTQDDIMVGDIPALPPFNADGVLNGNINLTINSTIAITSPNFSITTGHYKFITAEQHTYDTIGQTLNDYFAKNSLFTISLAHWDDTDALTTAIEAGIIAAIPKALSADQIATILSPIIVQAGNISIDKPSATGDQVMKGSDTLGCAIIPKGPSIDYSIFTITGAKYTVT